MTDLDALITEELMRMTPITGGPDWDAITRAARGASPRRLLRSRRQVVAVALAALVLAGASIAAIKEAPWWESGAPAVDPQAVASVARDNMPATVDITRARTVVQDGDAALVAVPIKATGYCLIPALNGRGDLGAQCQYQLANAKRGDDDRAISLAHPASANTTAAWLVYGRITDPRAASVDLGVFTVPLGTGGFFLRQIPEGNWARLAGTANAGRILDANGGVLRSVCVNWGVSPRSVNAGTGDLPLFIGSSDGCRPQAPPAEPNPDIAHAQKLVQLTLQTDFSLWKAGTTVAIWQAPAGHGMTCFWVASAASPDPGLTTHGIPGGPGGCGKTITGQPSDGHPFAPLMLTIGGGGLILGHVSSERGIERVALASAAGTVELPFDHGWFLGQLPAGPRAELPPSGPFTLIGYDGAGNAIVRQNIKAVARESAPH